MGACRGGTTPPHSTERPLYRRRAGRGERRRALARRARREPKTAPRLSSKATPSRNRRTSGAHTLKKGRASAALNKTRIGVRGKTGKRKRGAEARTSPAGSAAGRASPRGSARGRDSIVLNPRSGFAFALGVCILLYLIITRARRMSLSLLVALSYGGRGTLFYFLFVARSLSTREARRDSEARV